MGTVHSALFELYFSIGISAISLVLDGTLSPSPDA